MYCVLKVSTVIKILPKQSYPGSKQHRDTTQRLSIYSNVGVSTPTDKPYQKLVTLWVSYIPCVNIKFEMKSDGKLKHIIYNNL